MFRTWRTWISPRVPPPTDHVPAVVLRSMLDPYHVPDTALVTDVARRFMVKPYGILGHQKLQRECDGKSLRTDAVAHAALTECLIVDAAGVPYIRAESTAGCNGAARALYDLAGVHKIAGHVSQQIVMAGDAAVAVYGKFQLLHVACYNLRPSSAPNGIGYTAGEAEILLTKAWYNILSAFADTPFQHTLHALPISCGGFCEGASFKDDMSGITARSMYGALLRLPPHVLHILLNKNVYLCIYQEDEFNRYATALNTVFFPPPPFPPPPFPSPAFPSLPASASSPASASPAFATPSFPPPPLPSLPASASSPASASPASAPPSFPPPPLPSWPASAPPSLLPAFQSSPGDFDDDECVDVLEFIEDDKKWMTEATVYTVKNEIYSSAYGWENQTAYQRGKIEEHFIGTMVENGTMVKIIEEHTIYIRGVRHVMNTVEIRPAHVEDVRTVLIAPKHLSKFDRLT